VTSDRDFYAKQQRAADAARALGEELEVLQERLDRARAAKRINRKLVNQLERDIETRKLRQQLILANLVIRNLVFQGRRLLAVDPASLHFGWLAQMFEERLDQCDGILRCQICRKVGDESEMVVCDGGKTEDESGEWKEHHLLPEGNFCTSCVHELQKLATEQKARLGARHIH
jgi:hypothetical protein